MVVFRTAKKGGGFVATLSLKNRVLRDISKYPGCTLEDLKAMFPRSQPANVEKAVESLLGEGDLIKHVLGGELLICKQSVLKPKAARAQTGDAMTDHKNLEQIALPLTVGFDSKAP